MAGGVDEEVCGVHPPASSVPVSAFLRGHPSARGCSACGPVLFLPLRCPPGSGGLQFTIVCTGRHGKD